MTLNLAGGETPSQEKSAVPSYPCLKGLHIPQGQKLECSDDELVTSQAYITPHRCDSPWCPTCFRRDKAPKLQEWMESIPFDRARFVTLTVNREQYASPQEAYEKIVDKVSYLIHDLRRTCGRDLEYISALEWHRDGFPHWHLIIKSDKAGRLGQIGQEALHKYWQYGRIHETYFKTEKDWLQFAGYVGKCGYFDKKKAHQAILPEWARSYTRKIRRINRSKGFRDGKRVKVRLKPEIVGDLIMNREVINYDSGEKEMKPGIVGQVVVDTRKEKVTQKREYRVILEECGTRVKVKVYDIFGKVYEEEIPVKLTDVKKYIETEFIKGQGYVFFGPDEGVRFAIDIMRMLARRSKDEN